MTESVLTFVDLLTRPEFLIGLALGAAGLMLLAWHRRTSPHPQGWGLLLSCALVIGIQVEISWQPKLMAGIALLALGGWIRDPPRRRSVARSPARSAGGWFLILAGASVISWLGADYADQRFLPATMLAIVAFGWALSTWQQAVHRSALGPLFAITSFGVWTTVPDTDLARILFGASVPMALATIHPLLSRISQAGAYSTAGIFVWLPLWGSDQRTGSVIGAWACIGMIGLLPVSLVLQPRKGVTAKQLVALQAVTVLIAARIIGLLERATIAVAGAAALACLLLALVGSSRGARDSTAALGTTRE